MKRLGIAHAAFTLVEIVLSLAILLAMAGTLYPIAMQWQRFSGRSRDLFLENTVAGVVVDRVLDRIAYDPAALETIPTDSWGSVVASATPIIGPAGSELPQSPFFENLLDFSGRGAAHESNRRSLVGPSVAASAPPTSTDAVVLLASLLGKAYANLAVHVTVDAEPASHPAMEGAETLTRKLIVEVHRKEPGKDGAWRAEPLRVETRFLVPAESLTPSEASALQQRFLLAEQEELGLKTTDAVAESPAGSAYGDRARQIVQQLAILRIEASRESAVTSHLETAAAAVGAPGGSFVHRERLELMAAKAAAISLAFRRMKQALAELGETLYPAWKADVEAQKTRVEQLTSEARERLKAYEEVRALLTKAAPETNRALEKFRTIESTTVEAFLQKYGLLLRDCKTLHAEGRLFEFLFDDAATLHDLERLAGYPARFRQAVREAQEAAKSIFELQSDPPGQVTPEAAGPAPGQRPTAQAAAIAALRWAELERTRRLFDAEESVPKSAQDLITSLHRRHRDTFAVLAHYFGDGGPPLESGGELRADNPGFEEVFHGLRRLDLDPTSGANPAATMSADHRGGIVTQHLDRAGSLAWVIYKSAAAWVAASVALLQELGEQKFQDELRLSRTELAARVRQVGEGVASTIQPALEQLLTNRESILRGLDVCRDLRLSLMRQAVAGDARTENAPIASGYVCATSAGAGGSTTEPLEAALRMAQRKLSTPAGDGWKGLLRPLPGQTFPEPPLPGKFDVPPKEGSP